MRTARRHQFVDDPELRDPRTGQQWCACGRPAENEVHDLPDTSEANEESRRRVGEGDNE